MGKKLDTPPARVLLITHSRTCSHLLEKMLSNQPNVLYSSHHFIIARVLKTGLLKKGPIDEASPEEKQELMRLFNEGYLKLLNSLAEGERKQKTMIIHIQPHNIMSPLVSSRYVYGEPHSTGAPEEWLVGQPDTTGQPYTNISVLPDEIFLNPGTKPIINFRHPILMIDGIYRGMNKMSPHNATPQIFRYGCTLRWQRIVYDWFLEHGAARGVEPILVDADDYLGPDKEISMIKLCDRVGLDASSVIYSWAKETAQEKGDYTDVLIRSKATLMASEGVIPGSDSKSQDLHKIVQSWKEKYGDEVHEFLRDLVEKAMPDYNYLRARRLMAGT